MTTMTSSSRAVGAFRSGWRRTLAKGSDTAQRGAEALLSEGPDAIVAELMECIPEVEKRRRDRAEALQALDNLVGYYRNNERRMNYRLLREEGLPIGSGAVESAHRHVLQTRMKCAGVLVDAQRPPDGPAPRRIPRRRCAVLLRRDPPHPPGR
jgi:hypothetical protein